MLYERDHTTVWLCLKRLNVRPSNFVGKFVKNIYLITIIIFLFFKWVENIKVHKSNDHYSGIYSVIAA